MFQTNLIKSQHHYSHRHEEIMTSIIRTVKLRPQRQFLWQNPLYLVGISKTIRRRYALCCASASLITRTLDFFMLYITSGTVIVSQKFRKLKCTTDLITHTCFHSLNASATSYWSNIPCTKRPAVTQRCYRRPSQLAILDTKPMNRPF